MKTLIAMHGFPRSGKSTISRRLARELGAPIVNADAVRLALHGQRFEALAEPMVKAIRVIMVRALFEAGHNVVIYDETNFSRSVRDSIKSDKWDTLWVNVPTDAEECKRRAIATEQPDLLPVIDAMALRHEPLAGDEPRYVLPWVEKFGVVNAVS
jgi:predicted kinase